MAQTYKRYWLEYLHKRDREPIYDTLRWEYSYASRLKGWRLEKGRMHLEVESSQGEAMWVELAFLGTKVVSIRAFLKPPPPTEAQPLLLKTALEEVRMHATETEDSIVCTSGEVDCIISKPTWSLKLRSKDGTVFFDEYLDGLLRDYFPVYPLGCKVVNGERHFLESITLRPDEAIYGFGETFGPLQKRGQNIFVWTCDTTHTSGVRSYKAFPFYMSTRGYGLLVNTSYKTVFEVGSEYCYNALSLEAYDNKLEYIVFYGPSFKEILEAYTEMTGRSPMPPLWSFGLWMSRAAYTSRQMVEEAASKLRKMQVPCDVIHIDPPWMRKGHYCDLEWDEEAFPNPLEMLGDLRKTGFRICLWEQPYVPQGTAMYKEGLDRGFFLKDERGEVMHIPDFTRSEVATVDFTNPEAREWYKRKHLALHRMGVSVFKCDMGDAVPEGAVFHSHKSGKEMHNLYPIHYVGCVYEAAKEHDDKNALVWGRPGYVGIQRYPAQWSGDSHCTFEDMACVLKAGLSYSISGVPFWGHDIGGFQGRKPSPTLYVRWAQWGLLSPLSRCHGVTPREPWEYGEEALRIFTEYARLRYSLLPYIHSYAKIASRTGLPLVRPLILEYQDDPEVRKLDLQYLLGESILIVPVFDEEGSVSYYVPKGEWVDFWSQKRVEGGRWMREKLPLDKIPILIKQNSLIPRVDPLNHTGEKPVTEVKLDVWLRDKAILDYCFDGEAFAIEASGRGEKTVLTLGPSRKSWTLLLHDVVKPSEAEVERGQPVKWSYSDRERTCSINLTRLRERATVSLQ